MRIPFSWASPVPRVVQWGQAFVPSDLMLRPLLGVGERVRLKTPEIHSAEVREGRKTVHCNVRNVAEEQGV